MKAKIEIECKNPQKIIDSIQPDVDDNDKFEIKMKKDNDKIVLNIESKDIAGMMAAVNSYLKFIRTLDDLEEIE